MTLGLDMKTYLATANSLLKILPISLEVGMI